MKYLITFVVCLLLKISCFAQVENRAKVYIDVDPVNCISCIGSLRYMKAFEAAKIDYYFVLEEKFKPEKDYIKEKYRLSSYKAKYIWSDSLFQMLHTAQNPYTVTLISSTGKNKIVIPLLDLNPKNTQYLLNKCKLVDTFHFKKKFYLL